jgi:hypothetical protein
MYAHPREGFQRGAKQWNPIKKDGWILELSVNRGFPACTFGSNLESLVHEKMFDYSTCSFICVFRSNGFFTFSPFQLLFSLLSLIE